MAKKNSELQRCPSVSSTPIALKYHDEIWGTPSFDERFLFEMLSLSAFQAGLNWWIVYNKLDAFRSAFLQFDIDDLAGCNQAWVDTTARNPEIIRNSVKINAVIWNAQLAQKTRQDGASFSDFLWSAVGGRPVFEPHVPGTPFPARSEHGDVMSKKLKEQGFKFCGPTICHAFMQSVGMIVQHTEQCFRYQEIKQRYS